MPMKSDENSKSVTDMEECTMKQLKKEKEAARVWVKQSEEKKCHKKTNKKQSQKNRKHYSKTEMDKKTHLTTIIHKT